jgi:hypothetical protein
MSDAYADLVCRAQVIGFTILNTYREKGEAEAETLWAEFRAQSTPEMVKLVLRELQFHSEGSFHLSGRQQ